MRALRAAFLIFLGCVCAVTAGAAASKLSHIRAHGLVYSAHADVDGDGRPDLVTLHRHPAQTGHLLVRLATRRRLTAKMSSDAPFVPGLAASGNVNGTRGDELFVDMHHLFTNDVIGIFTYVHGRIRLVGQVLAFGNDYPLRFGVTCTTHGARHVVIDHEFQLHFAGPSLPSFWTRQDTFFRWKGSALRLTAKLGPRRIAKRPPTDQVGIQCGHAPSR